MLFPFPNPRAGVRSPALNVLSVFLLCAAFAVAEVFIGGTRLLFGLPAYLLLATAALFSLGELRRVKARPNPLCLAATGLFLGYVLVRGFTSPVAYIAWTDEFIALGALAVYLLTACHLTNPRERWWVLAFLLAAGVVNVLVGARQFVAGDDFMLLGFLRSDRYNGRASGLYICPDHLAFFLEVVGCLTLAWAAWGRGRPAARLVMGYGAVFLFGGELLTLSRGGFLSAAAGLSVMALLGLGRVQRTTPHRARQALAVAGAAALAVLGIRVAVSQSALLQSRARRLVSPDVRPGLWRAGYAQFRLSPIFGTGASTYLYYGRRLRDPRMQDDPIRTHNDYVELLGEYGAVGAAGLLLFLGAHLGFGWLTYRRFARRATERPGFEGGPGGSNGTAWNIGALSASAAIAAHSVVDFNLHIPANALLTAFVFGVLANPGRPAVAEAGSAARLRWTDGCARLALGAVGLALFIAGVPRLPGEYYGEMARAALRDRRFLTASGYALKGLEYERHNPQLDFYLGEARLNLAGDGPDTPVAHSFREGADEAYCQGLRLAPCDSALLLRHAQLLTIFGDYPAAERVLAQAQLWDPNSGLVQIYLGFFLQRTGRLAEAKQAYTRAVQLTGSPAGYERLAQLAKLEEGTR